MPSNKNFSMNTLAMTFLKELTSEEDKLFRLVFAFILLTVQVLQHRGGGLYEVIPNNTCARTWGQRGEGACFKGAYFQEDSVSTKLLFSSVT